MNIQDLSSTALLKRRHQLARGLPPIEQILRGSLIETYKRCGRPNCHCVDGPGHGPKRYLSTISRTGERPRVGYVPNAAHAEVREFLANFRKLREVLNEICAINAELLRRREKSRLDGPGRRCPRHRQGGRHPRQHDRILSCWWRPAVQPGGSRS